MPKRSLILAGGGLKVGFQAGVLQVWLDEAGLTFDHADGASGGCFNLAMYCQGMSGRQIADAWRTLDPFLPVDLNLEYYWRFLHAPSLFTYDNFRQRVLPSWGIDWSRIRSGSRLGTFNLFNFSKKRLETVTNDRMTEDHLIAAVSLPMWFPPVKIGGDTYIDAVYISDANVEEAIRRGADEIWAIWTVSTSREWRDGFVAQYFHLIETCADTHFFGTLARIDENNRRIAEGQAGEFGRPITVRLLQAEVPVHYLFNFSRDRMAESVNLGVKTAREWCRNQGVALPHPGPEPGPVAAPDHRTSLQFSEEMKGSFALGVADPEEGEQRGKAQGSKLAVALTIRIDDADRFMTDPDHAARIEGRVKADALGGETVVDAGTFNLLVQAQDPAHKEMRYRIVFRPGGGEACTLVGVKHVGNDRGADIWSDTTTLFVRVYRGVVTPDLDESAQVRGAGIIRIEPLDFLRQLTTFRAEGPSLADRIGALSRFGMLFFGKLWDVYGRQLVEPSPL